MVAVSRFHWADYLVFFVLLGLSAGIGLFYGIKDRKKKTAEDFLLGGRKMSVFPVSVSMFATLMSSIMLLGDPVEVYYYGAGYVAFMFGAMLGIVPVAQIFVPLYHRLHFVSAFQFIERRYNRVMRKAASVTQVIVLLIMMSITLYAPSLALSQASGMSIWLIIILTGTVCTFYTTFGGMKAVVWADTIQTVVMVVGVVTLTVQGTLEVGGITKVWEHAREGGRLDIFRRLDPTPFTRSSFWTYLIGGFFKVFIPYISTQLCIQRYCTLETGKKASLSVYLNVPMFGGCIMMFFLIGIVMFSYYHECDPLLSGKIRAKDQMVPLFVIEVLGFLPGIPGLFISSLFSASLSTISSGQNALAANILSDFIQPWYLKRKGKPLNDQTSAIVAKILAASVGVLVVLMSFMVLEMGGSVFLLANMCYGMLGGPLAGVFMLAVLFPGIGVLSVVTGFASGLLVCLWWGIGAIFHPGADNPLPSYTYGCLGVNSTLGDNTTFWHTTSEYVTTDTAVVSKYIGNQDDGFGVNDLYKLSPVLYAPLGTVLTVLVSIITSFCSTTYRSHWKYSYKGKSREDLKGESSVCLDADPEDQLCPGPETDKRRPGSPSSEAESPLDPSPDTEQKRPRVPSWVKPWSSEKLPGEDPDVVWMLNNQFAYMAVDNNHVAWDSAKETVL